ncbi:Glycosyl hydrolases family 2 [Granulicella rosea]|uniref:Glycosyl hydrolases family 2 n=1 Tax=Granulicella rosea TaxID=474952 RepID=A0A239LXT6_9BACT|nr:discoidin domain-containing protein [Granulicella rosea]SNT34782.1 Glycosyl hydrolases family 2 [Granulicella rosea]
MRASRREFIKTAVAAGAGLAAPVAMAEGWTGAAGAPAEPVSHAATGTRGIGVYPGAAAEYAGPSLIPAGTAYRNLALHRPAYHSSSYDLNLTAQLVTDGLHATAPPEWTAVSVDGRVLEMDEREVLFDHFLATSLLLPGLQHAIELHLGGGADAPQVDRLRAFVTVPDGVKLTALSFRLWSSADGHDWQAAGAIGAPAPHVPPRYGPDFARGAHPLWLEFALPKPLRARFYRLELECAPGTPVQWRVAQMELYEGQRQVELGGPYRFTSAWKSAGLGTEWISIDLGVACTFDRVVLHWIAPPAEGRLQVSDDGEMWRDLQALPVAALPATAQPDEIRLTHPALARYIRALLTQPATAEGYVLSEFEVFGRGGLRASPQAASSMDRDGRLALSGGGWRLQRAEAGMPGGEALSRVGRDPSAGVVATVPGTVLTSYLNAGAIPDPNFGHNQLYISDSYFYADFWYTTEFHAPQTQTQPQPGERLWLEFAGVNWRAEVWLNGERLGRIEGGFQRGRFDITGRFLPGAPNALAVKVQKNATPGSARVKSYEDVGKNGGALGLDNPTYHASAGWDWIPTIRGRNTGIWGEVAVAVTGDVTLNDPLVSTVLADGGQASVAISVDVFNHGHTAHQGVVRGRFGDLPVQQTVSLEAGASHRVQFDLKLEHPKLWQPAGYGEPHLYTVELRFEQSGRKSGPALRFQAGVRQITYSEEGGALRIYVNGRRLVPKGGNWGFSESMLRYRAREYDAAVRYHREMNFNIVRNWVGQIGDDAFYEACDRHGLLVWQDFWLANTSDGPEPSDDALFLANARDVVRRIRRHACVGLYCGRNEGYPPPTLEHGLRSLLAELHPDIHYIPSSADGVVSGRGPYHALSPESYFRGEDTKFHSEIGAPAIPSYDSVQAMMSASSLWPQGLDWGIHDLCLHGAQGGQAFLALIESAYGGASGAKEWVELAQFVNYDTYRAMFEAQGRHRMGVLLWMSHPCWPSFVWQTYDYYLEPTSAYFGCRKAAEPLHIQWNPATEQVEVVNASAGAHRGLAARAEILDPHGISLGMQEATLDSAEDSVATPIALRYPKDSPEVHVLRLTLRQGGSELSTNTYLRGREAGNYRAIRAWGRSRVTESTTMQRDGDAWRLTSTLRNTSQWPSLMVRVKVVRERSGDRILPAIYSDNYLTLMPGESRTVGCEVAHADTRGERPRVVVEWFR